MARRPVDDSDLDAPVRTAADPESVRIESFEALIDHIEITSDDTIVPVYRVPMADGPHGPVPDRSDAAASAGKTTRFAHW